MSKINFLVAAATAAILIAPMITGAAQAQPLEPRHCPGPGGSAEGREEHQTILEHAILAELAYGGAANANGNTGDVCPGGQLSWATPPDQWLTGTVPDYVINQARDALQTSEGFDGEVLLAENGYISCQRDRTVAERLAAAYRFAAANGGLSLWVMIAIIGVDGITYTEEIAIRQLRNDQDDEMLVVQGVDLGRFSQLSTIYNNLIDGRGCIFPLSVEVARAFFDPDNVGRLLNGMEYPRRFGAVGHSLGGAVVQHLMTQSDALKHVRNGRTDDEFEFRAYSFNSIGVMGHIPEDSPIRWLTSVSVTGEVLEQVGNISRALPGVDSRRQVGNVYRYWMSRAALRHHEDGACEHGRSWIIPNSIKLHCIATVRTAVCGCLDGTSPEFEGGFRR